MITKSQIAKFYAAADWRLLSDGLSISNRGPNCHDALHSLPTGGAALIEIHDIADRDQWPDQPQQIHVEFGELPDADFAAHGQRHARPNDQHEPDANQECHQRPHHRVDAHQAQILLRVLPVQSIEGCYFCALLRIGAHYADAGEVLLCARRDLGKEILDLLLLFSLKQSEILLGKVSHRFILNVCHCNRHQHQIHIHSKRLHSYGKIRAVGRRCRFLARDNVHIVAGLCNGARRQHK